MHYARKTRVLLAALLVFGLPAGASAQVAGTVSVEGHGGLAVPLGTLGDLTSTGGTFGGGLAVHLTPNVALRGDVMLIKVDNGRDDSGTLLSPPVDFLYYGGGIELNFNAPLYQDLPLSFAANLEAGWTNMDVDETFDGPAEHPAENIDQGYLTFSGGGMVGFRVYRSADMDANVFVRAQPSLILTDSNDMVPYGTLLEVEPFDHVWLMPLTAGVRLTF